jgi:hypothetical protein
LEARILLNREAGKSSPGPDDVTKAIAIGGWQLHGWLGSTLADRLEKGVVERFAVGLQQ